MRAVSDSLPQCQLTHLNRVPIDVSKARVQHAAYQAALENVGVSIVKISPLHDHPDAVFVEDTAVVLDELAIVARPGVPSRQAETEDMSAVLMAYRAVKRLVPPSTLDGGDVLRVARKLYVGCSERTNEYGVEQLQSLTQPYGYEVVPVPVCGCVHLKTGATLVDEYTVLVNPAWVSADIFFRAGHEIITVPPDEPWGANVLRLDNHVLIPDHVPSTRDVLVRRGIEVSSIDISELQKAEAGMTCLSILVQ